MNRLTLFASLLALHLMPQTQAAVQTAEAYEGKVTVDVKLTIYPDAKHDSWTAAYDDAELWKWLFAQKRTSR